MGLTIRVKSKNASAQPIDMGCGGFLRLRNRVAKLYGEPWASHYAALVETSHTFDSKDFYDDFGDILPGSIDPRLLKERKAREPGIALHRSML